MTEHHDTEEYLKAIRNGNQTTTEIQEYVGLSTRQGADYRLRQLEDDGLVEGEKLGNTLVWSLPADSE